MTVTISGLGRHVQLAGVALVLIALAIALFARPASAAVTGTATPSTALESSGSLVVSASGFAADNNLHTVYVMECERGATVVDQCDANTGDSSVTSTTAGNYTNNAYLYYQLPNAAFGNLSNIKCDASHECDLLVIQDDYQNFSNPHVLIPIEFKNDNPATTTVSTTSPVVTSTTTTTPTGATSTTLGTNTTIAGETTTAVSGTTAVDGTTSVDGTSTTVSAQGIGSTLPGDPSGGGSVDSSGGGSGGQLPFTGPPTAAPIIAVCGLVILFAGTLMRRVVLRVPDSGVSIS